MSYPVSNPVMGLGILALWTSMISYMVRTVLRKNDIFFYQLENALSLTVQALTISAWALDEGLCYNHVYGTPESSLSVGPGILRVCLLVTAKWFKLKRDAGSETSLCREMDLASTGLTLIRSLFDYSPLFEFDRYFGYAAENLQMSGVEFVPFFYLPDIIALLALFRLKHKNWTNMWRVAQAWMIAAGTAVVILTLQGTVRAVQGYKSPQELFMQLFPLYAGFCYALIVSSYELHALGSIEQARDKQKTT